MNPDPVDVVVKFEQTINQHDPAAIAGMLIADSVFVDSMGTRIEGRENLRTAWQGYFKMVPDYAISHEEIFRHGDTVAMFGKAQGTFVGDGELRKENFWSTTAAWRALVKDDKIAVWQVYADNEPIRSIMRRNAVASGS